MDLQDLKVGETDGQSHPVGAHRVTEAPRRPASSCLAEAIITLGERGGCDLIPRVLRKRQKMERTSGETIALDCDGLHPGSPDAPGLSWLSGGREGNGRETQIVVFTSH